MIMPPIQQKTYNHGPCIATAFFVKQTSDQVPFYDHTHFPSGKRMATLPYMTVPTLQQMDGHTPFVATPPFQHTNALPCPCFVIIPPFQQTHGHAPFNGHTPF